LIRSLLIHFEALTRLIEGMYLVFNVKIIHVNIQRVNFLKIISYVSVSVMSGCVVRCFFVELKQH
jgi:hypothetical protein